MPEVPELNVMGITLERKFKGQKVRSIEILWKKRVEASEKEFQDALTGGKLKSVEREGKLLRLKFDNDNILGMHLMLTGRIVALPSDEDIKYPIFELLFDNGTGIIVADGLGQAKPILNPEIPNIPDIEASDFTFEYFKTVLSKSGGKIKDVIQDQKKIRGIGNAYADEILWHSKVSPWSIAKKIPEKAVKVIYDSIRDVTKAATKQLASMSDSDTDFTMENKDHRFVHNAKRTHSPDGEEILKGKVGQSKTYYSESQVFYE